MYDLGVKGICTLKGQEKRYINSKINCGIFKIKGYKDWEQYVIFYLSKRSKLKAEKKKLVDKKKRVIFQFLSVPFYLITNGFTCPVYSLPM